MIDPSFSVSPDIFRFNHQDIDVTHCCEDDVEKALPDFLKSVEDSVVGLAPIYGRKCRLTTLAIASDTRVLMIDMSTDIQIHCQKDRRKPLPNSRKMLQEFLCDSTISKYAFQMDKLATALYLDFNVCLTHGKDLLSVSVERRHSSAALMDALGGEHSIDKAAVTRLFQHEETALNQPITSAMQAWAAYSTACFPDMARRHETILPIDTLDFDTYMLGLVARTIRNSACCVALKPMRIENEVKTEFNTQSGQLIVTSERFKTRVLRPSGSQVINVITNQADGTSKEYRGRALHISGRTAIFEVNNKIAAASIRGMETVGREGLNNAERSKESYMLEILQRKIDLKANHPFVWALWFASRPAKKKTPAIPSWKGMPALRLYPLYFPGDRSLNKSQTEAVHKILSDEDADRVVLVHGPPGTGKTTVIAASVTSIMASRKKDATVWLVAQSNVAVKNMAEKLASLAFLEFKIIVSKDFHFDWHEHLYEKIEANLVRTDDLVDDVVGTERQLLESRVILCTLGTLSNDRMSAVARLAPPQLVIFDEASQIEIGQYFPMLLRFHSTLSKLVFIGDKKQLAPHGADDIKSLHSVFDKEHLLENSVFLDTQYRMPIPIGNFISEHVYKNRLKSQHDITDLESCRFVDVSDGHEESKGHSWQNTREVDVVVAIARQLTGAKKSFRVITPYDPQRSLLERGLKHAELPWQDKCFNIDAFQGNEDDYIIVSLVRSVKLGFLNEQCRVNVMLTRCKKCLIICANGKFLEGPGSTSLVGKLFQSIGTPWIPGYDVQHKGFCPFS